MAKSNKKLPSFTPEEIVRLNGYGFKRIMEDHASDAYARMEMVVPWPRGLRSEEIEDYQPQCVASATILRKAFDFAINGLRDPQEQFTVEVSHSPNLGNRAETDFSVLVFANSFARGSDFVKVFNDPEAIVKFLSENQQQIIKRVQDHLAQNQSQEI